MQNPAKAIVLALLVAIPSPFILGFLLVTFTPELFQILSQAGTSEEATSTTFVLGSAQGIAAYIIAVVLFGLAGFVTVALAAKKPSAVKQQAPRASTAPRQPAPRKQQSQPDYEDDDDYDDSTPEGNEEGTVKWFNVKKGFGFIVRDSGDEVFVHFRAIRGRGRRVLRQGQLVRFSVVEADKGLQADNVSILSD
ncbi:MULTISPECIES: cold shock domain-containing protein [Marinobacter]|uniref:Cold-shock DNA-binding protein family n=2 Tax=Marinobacter TaxID=2742 RepID=W5YTC9_9GAMM|nr:MULTISPECIES: cold shock domain-containing protein [Marinobacter]AHI32310.1 cold-shock protein [Marinobacter salarius]ARM84871.1 major cold shock protein CspA [Marinobacter salarius]KXJ45399.1 MAG: cold-shock protein [Marinobacter sp. Hex_13]MAB52963.1 cold-shock protein [Marinobacter sp.]MBJ7301498.1 cold shock domain-containing protein [Marinobacter salarius]